MKKQFLLNFLIVALFMGSGINYVSAQIQDFDNSYCYQILINNHESETKEDYVQYALGVADDEEEACLQQMEQDATDLLQLWKIEELDEATYHIVNLSTDKALGESSWRNVPTEGADQETSTSPTGGFNWNGPQPGVVQLTKDKTSEKQQWILVPIATDTITTYTPTAGYVYQPEANWDLDSAKYWNFWNGGGGVGLGIKNIVIFSTVLAESDRIGLPNNYYGYYFIKTSMKNPDVVSSVGQTAAEKMFQVYAHDGFARISGNIEGKLVQVYNIQGQVVFNSIVSASEINVSLNNKGVYIVKVGDAVNKFVLR